MLPHKKYTFRFHKSSREHLLKHCKRITSEMPKPTDIAPFSAPPLTLDWKRALGLVTLAPLRIVILTPLLLLVWATARIGLIGMEEGEPVEEGGYRELLQRINIAIARYYMHITQSCILVHIDSL